MTLSSEVPSVQPGGSENTRPTCAGYQRWLDTLSLPRVWSWMIFPKVSIDPPSFMLTWQFPSSEELRSAAGISVRRTGPSSETPLSFQFLSSRLTAYQSIKPINVSQEHFQSSPIIHTER